MVLKVAVAECCRSTEEALYPDWEKGIMRYRETFLKTGFHIYGKMM
jgi:hypothetical protein